MNCHDSNDKRSFGMPVDFVLTHLKPLILYERSGTIRSIIDRWFRRGGVRPRVTMELGNAEAIKRLVAAGLGLVAIALKPPLVRELGIVRRRDKPASPVLDSFLAELGERGRRG